MEILTPYRIVKSKDESVTSGDIMCLSENLDLNSLNEQDGCRRGSTISTCWNMTQLKFTK